MWLIEGPFDGEESGALNFRSELSPIDKTSSLIPRLGTKLLRTAKEYAFGRKGTPLLVNSKKISGEHGVFQVGEFDVENPVSRAVNQCRSF